MLEFEGINYLAVVATWVVYCAIGAWWYSPVGFAKAWEKYAGNNILKIPEGEATRILFSVVGSAALQAFTLAVLLNSLAVKDVVSGVLVALVLWLGLVTATAVGVTLYSRRSWKFLWLNSSYFLVVMLLGAVLLTVW